MSAQELLYIEMDCPKCPLNFGVSPCSATGVKCKNTPATCKDLTNYAQGETQTVRWVKAADFVPVEPYAVPNLNSVAVSSQRINPGENLGKRERITATFFNHAHNDVDLDPYVATRSYNPYEQGSYWGKFAAMYPNVQGYPVRIIRGNTDQSIQNMQVSHYVADVGKIAGDNKGYSIAAKDILDFSEGNKTLCPTPSLGLIANDITESASAVTLEPAGVGAGYPLSFDASIGDECMVCTRSGDVVTFTQRGAYNTVASAHDDGDTLQVMESFVSQNASQILERLLSFTETPAEYYDAASWSAQVALVSSPSLTARIAEPTPVFELIQDLMKDLALDIHTDVVTKKIVMRFLINLVPTALLTDDNINSPSSNFYEDKRVDLVFLSFGRKNPLLKMDEPRNYPVTLIRQTVNPVSLLMGNPAAITRHRSRWISSFLRPLASQTAKFLIDRYERAPRGLSCVMKNSMAPSLAQVVNVKTSVFENEFGENPTIPMQVVSVSTGQGNSKLELEEFSAGGFDPSNLDIVISLSESLLDLGIYDTLRDLYNAVYPSAIPAGASVTFEADPNVVYGGVKRAGYPFAVVMGEWPETADGLVIKILGLTIVGFGGNAYDDRPGLYTGGNAFYTRAPVELVDCLIGGGGGGGGFYNYTGPAGPSSGVVLFGGGGAGEAIGIGHENGTLTAGGNGNAGFGFSGGAGGSLGQPGEAALGGSQGGLAGLAIDGLSFVTISGTTTIFGATI